MTRATVEHQVLIASCAISAGIHAALAPEHLREEPAAGVGFLVSVAVLAVLCVVLIYRPASRIAVGAAGATLAGLLRGVCAGSRRRRPRARTPTESRPTGSPW